jgi:hypothetical protein
MTMEEMWNMRASSMKSSAQPVPPATNQVFCVSKDFLVIRKELVVG